MGQRTLLRGRVFSSLGQRALWRAIDRLFLWEESLFFLCEFLIPAQNFLLPFCCLEQQYLFLPPASIPTCCASLLVLCVLCTRCLCSQIRPSKPKSLLGCSSVCNRRGWACMLFGMRVWAGQRAILHMNGLPAFFQLREPSLFLPLLITVLILLEVPGNVLSS